MRHRRFFRMDLQCRDIEKSDSAAISLCALDESDDRHADLPYSPELNPDELAWNDVKNNGVDRASVRDSRDLDRAVNSRLLLLQNNPEKVRAFFRMNATRYAAA
jgi:hypothetical protein